MTLNIPYQLSYKASLLSWQGYSCNFQKKGLPYLCLIATKSGQKRTFHLVGFQVVEGCY